MEISFSTISKYEQPLPRYTSYPTVPFWNTEEFSPEPAFNALQRQLASNPEVSLYIHLPYCESLCTFCGCNRRITKNHHVEEPYISALLKEWGMFQFQMPVSPVIANIHLGGGTPTFFAPVRLERLISHLIRNHKLSDNYEFSIEVHPNTCTHQHIDVLSDLGFRRISVGIQDFDPKVQFIINRNQTFEKTREVIEYARDRGFTGINVDLVYGLPLQTMDSIKLTMEKISVLKPDRIAYYAYAHVPWKSKAQRRYTEKDLPQGFEKIKMFLNARKTLFGLGYLQVGMDHFALPQDDLASAWMNHTLRRNFMGYTTNASPVIIGLGASSISDFNGAYTQNYKEVESYLSAISERKLPIERGHIMSTVDLAIRDCIMDVMCRGKIQLPRELFQKAQMDYMNTKIEEFLSDGVIVRQGDSFKTTDLGNLLLRNIAAIFDSYLFEKGHRENMFSKSV